MSNPNTELVLTRLALSDVDRVRMLRLANAQGRPQLLFLSESPKGENLLSVIPLDAPGTMTSAAPLESGLGVPQWDVSIAGAGSILVWTKPGSALCPLEYRSKDGKDVILTGRYRAGVFMNPRFVRGDPAAPMVTAIHYGDTGRAPIIFSGALESAAATYQPLPAVTAGMIEQQLLLKSGGDSYFFLKVRSGPATPERTDGAGSTIQPGQIYLLRLSEALEVSGQATKPLGDTPVYEFDADISGSRAVLVATTALGVTVVTAEKVRDNLRWAAPSETPAPGQLLSPVVTLIGPNAVVAAIGSLGTREARVVVARI
jgi:hypothetical protein